MTRTMPPAIWPPAPHLPEGEIIVLAPEPASWLAPLLQQLGPHVSLWAPWARAVPPSGRWPAGIARALSRRLLPGARGVPGLDILDAALARVGADRPTLAYPLSHHRRRMLGHGAARLLARLGRSPSAIVAPSFAGTPLFAAARDQNMRAVLIQDWPDLAALHADLDRAARRHPGDPWLNRFRPPPRWIARQRSERHLADHVLVRGPFAAARLTADGIPPERITTPGPISPPPSRTTTPGADHVLLIGRGAARAGAYEALTLLERMPDLHLTGPLGSAALPDLRCHPRYHITATAPWNRVRGVLAPGWVEAYPLALAEATSRALPVIATTRQAGQLPRESYHAVEPGDVTAMQDALDQLP